MANMGYCRFQNTLDDMEDCLTALGEIIDGERGKLSKEEHKAARYLMGVCREFLELQDALEDDSLLKEGLEKHVLG